MGEIRMKTRKTGEETEKEMESGKGECSERRESWPLKRQIAILFVHCLHERSWIG
jgi:hypothetical protein